MPTKSVTIGTTETIIVDGNGRRTVLTLANKDTVDTIYVSDEAGIKVGDGFPIFPQTFISLPRYQGEKPQKKWVGIAAVASDLAVLESFGEIPAVEPDPEPSPQEPFHPQDAPLMRRRP